MNQRKGETLEGSTTKEEVPPRVILPDLGGLSGIAHKHKNPHTGSPPQAALCVAMFECGQRLGLYSLLYPLPRPALHLESGQ